MFRSFVSLTLEGCVVKEHAIQLSASCYLEEGHELRKVGHWVCFCTLMVLSKANPDDHKSEYSQEKSLWRKE
jgi:hypothetical protein